MRKYRPLLMLKETRTTLICPTPQFHSPGAPECACKWLALYFDTQYGILAILFQKSSFLVVTTSHLSKGNT